MPQTRQGPKCLTPTNAISGFYDNREKYLLFVSTCSEKQVIAERVALDIRGLQPVPPAFAGI